MSNVQDRINLAAEMAAKHFNKGKRGTAVSVYGGQHSTLGEDEQNSHRFVAAVKSKLPKGVEVKASTQKCTASGKWALSVHYRALEEEFPTR